MWCSRVTPSALQKSLCFQKNVSRLLCKCPSRRKETKITHLTKRRPRGHFSSHSDGCKWLRTHFATYSRKRKVWTHGKVLSRSYCSVVCCLWKFLCCFFVWFDQISLQLKCLFWSDAIGDASDVDLWLSLKHCKNSGPITPLLERIRMSKFIRKLWGKPSRLTHLQAEPNSAGFLGFFTLACDIDKSHLLRFQTKSEGVVKVRLHWCFSRNFTKIWGSKVAFPHFCCSRFWLLSCSDNESLKSKLLYVALLVTTQQENMNRVQFLLSLSSSGKMNAVWPSSGDLAPMQGIKNTSELFAKEVGKM